MKIALLGKGKTGSLIIELINSEPGVSLEVFDRAHPPERNALANNDIIISFLPGEAFLKYIPELIASGVPVVTGSTGFDWPGGREAFSDELSGKGLVWVHANNFSLGMSLVRQMIQILGMANLLFENCSYSMKEVHHAGKKDAPSGTALTWKEWLKQPVEILSERTGDVTGEHVLTLHVPGECISIRHSALDRNLFASGALYAARLVVSGRMSAQACIAQGVQTDEARAEQADIAQGVQTDEARAEQACKAQGVQTDEARAEQACKAQGVQTDEGKAAQVVEAVSRVGLSKKPDPGKDNEHADENGMLVPGLCDFQFLLYRKLLGAFPMEGSAR